MKITTLDLPYLYFFCPATGELILDTEKSHNPKSVMGYWIDEFPDEAYIFNKDLEIAYLSYLKEHTNDDSDPKEVLLNFLENLDISPCWAVFELLDNNPLGPSVYYVIDLETRPDEEKYGAL